MLPPTDHVEPLRPAAAGGNPKTPAATPILQAKPIAFIFIGSPMTQTSSHSWESRTNGFAGTAVRRARQDLSDGARCTIRWGTSSLVHRPRVRRPPQSFRYIT